jgi:hypothetical protein
MIDKYMDIGNGLIIFIKLKFIWDLSLRDALINAVAISLGQDVAISFPLLGLYTL